uniref:Uncharacterized protein n=1 Tax=Romanomermis culicivorax TaxID=13658 RepID=A0A915KXJ8_ROMCU
MSKQPSRLVVPPPDTTEQMAQLPPIATQDKLDLMVDKLDLMVAQMGKMMVILGKCRTKSSNNNKKIADLET